MQRTRLLIVAALAGLITPALAQAQPAVQVQPISSQVVALSWTSAKATYDRLEYSTTPFPNANSSFFPLATMSSTGFTRLRSKQHDLCPTDLTPDTLYHARVWTTSGRGGGNPIVSPPFTFRTPPVPPNVYTASKDNYGLQLAEEWRALSEGRKTGALTKNYIRALEVLQQWDEIQPTRGAFIWSIPDGRGLDDQLGDLTQRAGGAIGTTKFVTLKIRAGGALKGKRMPDWAKQGVENVDGDGPAKDEVDKVVRWDPQYICRYLQLIRAAGAKYGDDPAVDIVPVQAVSKTGEMTISDNLLAGFQDLGYTDAEIAANLTWLYRHVFQVYAEVFPFQTLQINMGRIPVMDNGQEVGYTILDAAAALYGKRIRFGTTGFGSVRAELLARYRDQVVVGGFSEQPNKESTDPVGELQAIFDLVWPHASGLGWVTLHDDALGIHPTRWSNIPELGAFLDNVESQFAQLRALP